MLDYVNQYFPDILPEEVSFDDYLNKSEMLYVSENKNIATKLVGQIGFHQNGVPIELQQSGYIGSILYSGRSVNIQDVPFSEVFNTKDGRKILYDINKITEVKDGDVASVPPKGGMGSLITITSAIDESIPKSNDDVKVYYLNITNPADEQTGYKALRKYQGQNEAGIKAREYLESLGYDGVNNGNEEYIAFSSNQIKLIDNATPINKSDIRYSRNTSIDDYDVKRYNEVDDNPHIVNAKAEESYRKNYYEIDTSTNGLFNDVKTRRSNSRYSEHGDEFLDGRRTTKPNDGLANRKIRAEDSDNGTGHTENDGDVDLRGEDNRKSRNTRLNHDENFDDVNDAFEQAIKVLQNIKGIDVSSEVVEEVGKAQRNIDKELDGYHAQKMRNKNSVGEIARKLKSLYVVLFIFLSVLDLLC